MRKNVWHQLETGRGCPSPLGATCKQGGWVDFALYSEGAKSVTLAFFSQDGEGPLANFSLNPETNKTGSIWHIAVGPLPQAALYAYEVDGEKWILDPYAKEIGPSWEWGEKKGPCLGKVYPNIEFDWEGDRPLEIPMEKTIIYEMHVRGLTRDPSSNAQHPGTYLGVIEKIPHLKKLGITAVELLPVFLFDDMAKPRNFWGYNPINFFCPMQSYASDQSQALAEFKTMVKALHKAGIEVILDVVYNHSAALERIDRYTYYLLGPKGESTNYSGCGNTIQANHPATLSLILDSLRYWVLEMHVDGFRFDLASVFSRGPKGDVLDSPAIIRAIATDRSLRKTKLIAEAWDCAGLYQVGSFPRMDRFSEWNGVYRDTVRRFLKGDPSQAKPFASALTGSEPLYDRPHESINFITAHDGFTLRDLVSYNTKHNEDNGEDNQDGSEYNDSWNCGVEGKADDPTIEALRERQMGNFILALAVSLGTPMLLMGDEMGHSRGGNNNPYNQDNEKNHFIWKELDSSPILSIFSLLFHYRASGPVFQKATFPDKKAIEWHGQKPKQPDWSETSRFVAYTLLDREAKKTLYIAFNSSSIPLPVDLPTPPEGSRWSCVFCTADLPRGPLKTLSLTLIPHSSCLLESVED